MRRLRFLFLCLTLAQAGFAQDISLHYLMRIHSADDSAIYAVLKQYGWAYRGIQRDVLRKPRMFSHGDNAAPEATLYLYSYHKKPLCKVELVSRNVADFNTTIRDSLRAYGFVPDMDHKAPDEDNLKITTSAYFINRDAAMPVHALILYFEERHQPKVSLTIYGDE
jgi:hypothetical protein